MARNTINDGNLRHMVALPDLDRRFNWRSWQEWFHGCSKLPTVVRALPLRLHVGSFSLLLTLKCAGEKFYVLNVFLVEAKGVGADKWRVTNWHERFSLSHTTQVVWSNSTFLRHYN